MYLLRPNGALTRMEGCRLGEGDGVGKFGKSELKARKKLVAPEVVGLINLRKGKRRQEMRAWHRFVFMFSVAYNALN